MKKITLLLALLMGTSIVGFAESKPETDKKFSGDVAVSGGLGAAQPWSGHIALQFKTKKLQFNPFFNLSGVRRSSSETDETVNLTYARPGCSYASSSNQEEKGLLWKYGTDIAFSFNPENQLKASVKVEQDRLERYGNGSETYTDGISNHNLLCYLTGKQHDRTAIDASASYLHIFKNPREQFSLRYDFSHLKIDSDEERFYVGEAPGNMQFAKLNTADDKVQTHTVTADWGYVGLQMWTLHAGAFYQNRKMEGEESQPVYVSLSSFNLRPLGADAMYGEFTHKMQTFALYTDYQQRLSLPMLQLPATMIVHLEYDYTKMQERKLNDFVPRATLIMPFNKHHSLTAAYVRRIIRPDFDKLNPFHFTDLYTNSYGNMELEGVHVNVANLIYKYQFEKGVFSTTASHIFVKDGFNGIWKFDERGRREYTWGNEGERTAWSVAPEVQWQLLPALKLDAKTTILWDKRIAEAISMAKEHWGVTAEAAATASLPHQIMLDMHGRYSEGNTIDLYSHESRSYAFGTALHLPVLPRTTLHLSFDYRDYARTVITQGAYVGSIECAPAKHFEALAKLVVKL